MSVRRGEVVIVDVPYSNQTGRKVRPALVIQADLLNQRQPADTIRKTLAAWRAVDFVTEENYGGFT